MVRFQLEVIGRLRGQHLPLAVLFGLLAMVKQGNLVTASRKEIGDKLGVSQPTLRKALAGLEKANVIRCTRRRQLIELNPRLFWQGGESSRQQEMDQWRPEFTRKPELRAV